MAVVERCGAQGGGDGGGSLGWWRSIRAATVLTEVKMSHGEHTTGPYIAETLQSILVELKAIRAMLER